MSIFSDKELESHQIEKLNNVLPEHYNKSIWKMSDFKGSSSIYNRISSEILTRGEAIEDLIKNIKKLKTELLNVSASKIIIFNTEPIDAKPLGMVDIGIIEKFGAPSTGDRFAGGAIGYAIESVIDEAWTKGNVQEQALNRVKLGLLKKAKGIYSDCNMLFKYEVDFREIGSSGNVFIYMRGTAAVGVNHELDRLVKEATDEILVLENQLKSIEKEIQELDELRNKVPKDKKQIIELLG